MHENRGRIIFYVLMMLSIVAGASFDELGKYIAYAKTKANRPSSQNTIERKRYQEEQLLRDCHLFLPALACVNGIFVDLSSLVLEGSQALTPIHDQKQSDQVLSMLIWMD